MDFQKLAPAFPLALIALLLAGCITGEGLEFNEVVLEPTDPLEESSECEGCACLVCERGELDPADIGADLGGIDLGDLPAGYTPEFLAQTGASGLQGARCWFQECGMKLKQQIEDNQRLFQKSFMLGVGDTSSEFRQAVKYCPMTDKWCGFWSPGTKDRWQNVFRSYGQEDLLVDYELLEEYEKTPPVNAGEGDLYDLLTEGGVPAGDVLCLFPGSYDMASAPGSTYYGAPPSLFCASGNCNKQRIYRSMCRKDVDGNGFNYDLVDGFPVDEVDCQCRYVRRYHPDELVFFDPRVDNRDELAGKLLCYTGNYNNIPPDNPTIAPFAQQCGATGTCIRQTGSGAGAICLEWEITDPGECDANDDDTMDLNEYGICESCIPTLDMVPMGDDYGDFPTDLWEDLVGEQQDRRHGGFLNKNILPVMNVRAWTHGGYEGTPEEAAKHAATVILSAKTYPAIFALRNPDHLALAHEIKALCPPLEEPAAGDPADPDVEKVSKQACLVAIEDTGFGDPLPSGSVDDVDILIADRVVTAGDVMPVPAYGNPEEEEPRIINQFITRAKEVQALYTEAEGREKFIGWLLYVEFTDRIAAEVLMSGENIDKLANAGFIGIIASGLEEPYFSINTLLDPDRFEFTQSDPASFSFFLGCGDYYNGTRQEFYVKEGPMACGCEMCGPGEDCTSLNLLCGETGLACVGPTQQPMPPGTTGYRCGQGCVPFPDAINYRETFDETIDCNLLSEAEKQEAGCYAICNVALVREGDVLEAVSWEEFWDEQGVSGGARGLAEPQPNWDAPDASGVQRFTPTNCYLRDTLGNFYKYMKMPGGDPLRRSYPIFDQAGADNLCGLAEQDLAAFLAGQPTREDLPPSVVR